MSKNFTIDARLILQLGRDSIKDHTTALIELIKNSYDADAKIVEVEIYSKQTKDLIRIADNGFGMTSDEIDENWLRIGFSEKRKSKKSETGRRKTGEKGIGRIAADRLGANLKMLTKSSDDDSIGIVVNWDEFDVDNKDVTEIKIGELKNPVVKIPENKKNTGTEIIITDLRQEWTKENIKNFYQELTYFTPLLNNKEQFQIKIKNDIDPQYSREVETAIYDAAEIDIHIYYDGDNKIIYEYKNKLLPKKNKIETFSLNEFITNELIISLEIAELNSGPIDINLYFFPRKSSLLEGTTFSLTDLRGFLDDNAGIKIYRDNIVVKPYGFQNSDFGSDWLGLATRKAKDPAGVSRITYKITPNQLVGFVHISRDENPLLKDSSGREGLVENESFTALKNLVQGSIILLESYRIEINKELKSKEKPKKTNTLENVKYLTEKLNSVILDLNGIKEFLKKHKDYKGSPITDSVNKIEQVIDETEQTFEDLLEEKRILSSLATLGISSAVFGHETESAINNFKLSAKNAKGSLTKKTPDINVAIEELDKALQHARLISSWGIFALARIEKDKRKLNPKKIKQIISKTLDQIKPAMDARSIEVIKELDHVTARTYPMDIESIILNLITNAYSAVPNTKRERKIRGDVNHEYFKDVNGFSIVVAGSGPGVAKEYLDKIWEPLFTTKIGSKDNRGGTGLGLTIVKSIVDELGGNIEVTKDEELKGANFKIWIPKI